MAGGTTDPAWGLTILSNHCLGQMQLGLAGLAGPHEQLQDSTAISLCFLLAKLDRGCVLHPKHQGQSQRYVRCLPWPHTVGLSWVGTLLVRVFSCLG